jgi:hypothetical protein
MIIHELIFVATLAMTPVQDRPVGPPSSGTGLLCDTPEQVTEVFDAVAKAKDSEEDTVFGLTIKRINEREKKGACAYGSVVFEQGPVVNTLVYPDKNFRIEIRLIVVYGFLNNDKKWVKLEQPDPQYTAYVVMEEKT